VNPRDKPFGKKLLVKQERNGMKIQF